MMKKTFAILILGLFVLGGLALAKENGNTGNNNVKNSDANGFVKSTSRAVADPPDNGRNDAQNLNRGMNVIATAAKEKTRVINTIHKLENFRKRVLTPANIKKMEDNFQAAKNRFMNAVNNHSQRKSQWILARDRYNKACRNNADSVECQKLLNDSIDRARQYLENSANLAISYLEQVKDKVDSTDSISDDRAAEIDSDIDKYINQLNDVLDDLNNADTKDEIKADAKKIDDIWKNARFRVRSYAAYMLGSKVMSLSLRSDNLADRLDCYLSEIKDQGNDIGNLQDKVDEFNSEISDSRTAWDEADQLYEEMRVLMKADDRDTQAIRNKADEIKDKVAEAHDSLRKAQALLTQIFREIRSYKVNIASCNGVANGNACDNDNDCSANQVCNSGSCKAAEVNDYKYCIDTCKDDKSSCLEGDDYANEESQAGFCKDEYNSCADSCADAANMVCNDAYDDCAGNCSDGKETCLHGDDYANEESQADFCIDEYDDCIGVCTDDKENCIV